MIAPVRRIHVKRLEIGEVRLHAAEAHHARDVLRLADRSAVEVFDDAGRQASALLIHKGASDAAVMVTQLIETQNAAEWTIAAAVPKGERADWMVEKLSELGATAFIPLAAERSVVLPQGSNKMDRWKRIAIESAKQSRRAMPMRIEPLISVDQLIANRMGTNQSMAAWYLSTEPSATPVMQLMTPPPQRALALVGPEGGWTDGEMQALEKAGFRPVKLTSTILRVETAAIAIAVLIGSSRR